MDEQAYQDMVQRTLSAALTIRDRIQAARCRAGQLPGDPAQLKRDLRTGRLRHRAYNYMGLGIWYTEPAAPLPADWRARLAELQGEAHVLTVFAAWTRVGIAGPPTGDEFSRSHRMRALRAKLIDLTMESA